MTLSQTASNTDQTLLQFINVIDLDYLLYFSPNFVQSDLDCCESYF